MPNDTPEVVSDLEKRRADVIVDRDALVKALGLPLSTQFKKITVSEHGDEITFDVRHKGLDPIEDGDENPIVSWEASASRPHFVAWNQ